MGSCYSHTVDYGLGNTYTGAWKNGLQHGQGMFTWADGSTYTGGWKDGHPHGQGVWTDTHGNTVAGGWVEGKKSGRIVRYNRGAMTEVCEFHDNVMQGIRVRFGDDGDNKDYAQYYFAGKAVYG